MKSVNAILLISLLISGVGCNVATQPTQKGEAIMAIQISSSAFSEGGTIPKKYTCDAENVSPPLEWGDVPAGTKSLALISDDPDAPAGTWVHWVIYDIPPTVRGFAEGIAKSPSLAGIGTQGNNDFRKIGYDGPCPPKGKPHRYYFKLYALDTLLNLKPGATKADVEKAMRGHILAMGQLMGTYGR